MKYYMFNTSIVLILSNDCIIFFKLTMLSCRISHAQCSKEQNKIKNVIVLFLDEIFSCFKFL